MDFKSRFKQFGMTQQDVGRALGMSQGRITQIFNGLKAPTKNQELQLLRLLTSLIEGKRRWPQDFFYNQIAGGNNGIPDKKRGWQSS